MRCMRLYIFFILNNVGYGLFWEGLRVVFVDINCFGRRGGKKKWEGVIFCFFIDELLRVER